MNLQQPRLTVLSGPSGVGKGTLVKALRIKYPQLWLSVSATTRLARQGEVDGIDYFFKSSAAFKALVASGGLLEWAEFAGNCYGTPRQPVEQRLAAGAPVLLEIELETGRTHQIRVHFSALRHPLVGDMTYGADHTIAERLEIVRPWLHARELKFIHPYPPPPCRHGNFKSMKLSSLLEFKNY